MLFSTIFNATETDVILAGDSEVFLCVLVFGRILLRSGRTDIIFLMIKYFLDFLLLFIFFCPGYRPGYRKPERGVGAG